MSRDVRPVITEEDMKVMEGLLSAGKVRHKYAVRIQTVLNRARGCSTVEVAKVLGINPVTVSRHVHRYNAGGIADLLRDLPRGAASPKISDATKNELTRIVCTEKPADGTHWSVRSLADRLCISHTSVHTILRGRGLKPHLVESFQFSNDPNFEKKLDDVVGLYLSPPENAIVLCVDEKSQIQALERSQPILPLRPGVPERQTHDYHRHGTTTLFAALNVDTGQIIGDCKDTHQSIDFITFLEKLDRRNPKKRVLHIILDNYSAHKSEAVQKFLAARKDRFVLHFIPTHSSWLNLVERWFAEITNKQIRRESWSSVPELKQSIKGFIRIWNDSGKKFCWVKTAEQIKERIARAKAHYAQ
jgi:transposase